MGVLAFAGSDAAAIVAASAAVVAALGSAAAAVITALNRRSLKTPSGPRIGAVVERTHELAVVNAARSARIDRAVNGDTVPPEEATG